MPWTVRLRMAADTAKAIAYLHSEVHPPIYHRDIKSSNILVDHEYNSKVADFGLSRMGMTSVDSSHISTAPQGTPGYVDPQYHQNFHLSDKSDVYSFGVVLLELLTGRRAMEHVRGRSAHAEQTIKLVDWTRPYLASSRRLRCIMYVKLAGHYSVKGARAVAHLAVLCTSAQPRDRPSMAAVVEALERLEGFKDMAVSVGIWPSAPVAGRNALSAKFRAEMKGAGVGVGAVSGRRKCASAKLA